MATRQQTTGAINIYVDGSLQTTGTAAKNTLNSSARLLFGAIASGGGFFNGSLDDVQIFSRVLSPGEVSALYGCNISPPGTAPANLTAAAGNSQVRLTWAAAPAASSYNVKRSLTSGGPYVVITNVPTAAFTDTNVVNSRTYYYVVSAVNAMGESTNSVPANANTAPLIAWFKADAITSTANGSQMPLWIDSTGNGFNAIQPLSTNQPIYVANAINGLPAVRFNSINSSYLWFYRPVQGDFTMILVFRSNQGISTGTSFWNGAGLVNGEQSGQTDDFGISLNANGQILAGTGHPDISINSGGGYNNNLPHLVTFKRTASTGSMLLYVDGAAVALGTGGTQSLTAPNFLLLGGQATLNNFLTGDIAEVQIYNAALSDIDRTGQERALKCKYGLSGGSSPITPSGLAGIAGNRQVSVNWALVAGATGYDLWRSTNNGVSYQAVATALTAGSFLDMTAANAQTNLYKVTASDGCGASAFSAVTSVPLPLPSLGLSTGPGSLVLSWPGWAADWGLYTATNLAPPVAWTPVTNTASSNSGQFNVTLPLNSPSLFFRLSAP